MVFCTSTHLIDTLLGFICVISVLYFLKNVYEWVFCLYLYVCTTYIPLSLEARRGHWLTRNWNYRWLWAAGELAHWVNHLSHRPKDQNLYSCSQVNAGGSGVPPVFTALRRQSWTSQIGKLLGLSERHCLPQCVWWRAVKEDIPHQLLAFSHTHVHTTPRMHNKWPKLEQLNSVLF